MSGSTRPKETKMEAFEAWWRAKFPGEAEKWDDPLYAGTEWREKHLRFLREVRREAWDAGIEWERGRHARTRQEP